MIIHLKRFALVAIALQCAGCGADAMVTGTGEPHGTSTRNEENKGQRLHALSNSDSDAAVSSASTPRPASVTDAAAQNATTSPYLVTESALIDRNGISSESTDPLLESKELFSEAFKRMSEDESKSIEAQDLSSHYRSALERAVGGHGVVENLACGLSLCIGSVSAESHADHDVWEERLYEDPSAVRHVILQVVERNGDRLQNRFLFSTDSAIKAIVLPPRQNR